MKKSFTRYLILFVATAALNGVVPFLTAEAQADDNGQFFVVLEGRGMLSEGDSTVWLEEMMGGLQIFAPTGRFTDIDTDYARYSGRAGLGYRSGAWDFGIFYSGLQALDDDETFFPDPPAGTPGGSIVLGLPSLAIAGIPNTFEASSSVTYTVIDLEAGLNVKLGPVDARFFGGLRYANFDQDINTFIAIILGFGTEHRDVNFWGTGLRVGASGSLPIRGPFGVTASVSGSGLFGEQLSVTTSQFVGPTSGNGRQSRNEFRATANFDGDVGVTFNHEMDNASTMVITLGYRAEAWLDVNDTRSIEQTRTGTIYGTTRADQIFHGPYLRGEWRFD